METIKLSIAKQYTRTPGPRYEKEGQFSGEKFRTELFFPLVRKAIQDDSKIIVDLDGTHGYGTSFLEEIFGGLIRINKVSFDEIKKHVAIKSNEQDYLIDDVNEYLTQAKEECEK